jgi:DNA-binding XRE family transcriptional regulator
VSVVVADPRADLGSLPDDHLRAWLHITDRRLIAQADQPDPADVAEYMALWDELKRREGAARAYSTRDYWCSCGWGGTGLATMQQHLDECGDDDDRVHLELAVPPGVVIARGIRRVRLERGLTMRAMAGLLGVHTSTVCRIESGNRQVRGHWKIHGIAALLGVPVEHLLAACPACGYEPPAGHQCMRCGTRSEQGTRL